MKIDDRIINYDVYKQLPKSTPDETEKVQGKQTPDGNDTEVHARGDQDAVVHLSQTSKEAQLIREVISTEPDVREEKVTELKEKIESGRYEINHEAVANKLVDSFLDEIS